MSKYLFISILVIGCFLISCEDELCTDSTDTSIKIELIRADKTLSKDFISSISLYSTEWNDSIHYSEDGDENMLRFPLSQDADTTVVIISNDTNNDTVSFFYNRNIKLISPACGFTTFYSLEGDTLNNTENVIDSIKVIQTEITNKDEKHITIYF